MFNNTTTPQVSHSHWFSTAHLLLCFTQTIGAGCHDPRYLPTHAHMHRHAHTHTQIREHLNCHITVTSSCKQRGSSLTQQSSKGLSLPPLSNKFPSSLSLRHYLISVNACSVEGSCSQLIAPAKGLANVWILMSYDLRFSGVKEKHKPITWTVFIISDCLEHNNLVVEI